MRNAGWLALGCLVATLAVWQLQAVGRGLAASPAVSQGAQQAYHHLLAAQGALAATDFAASQEQFSLAQTHLHDASQLLQEALASSRHVLRLIDVTGTVRSGEELLQAGEALTQAGQHASRGLAVLLNTTPLPQTPGVRTMVDALAVAFEEFSAAQSLLDKAATSLAQVDTATLPPEFAPAVEALQQSIPSARAALTGFLEQNQAILSVLGAAAPRQYLLLFQNNHELRPTGGFIGSVGLITIDRGVVENIDVQTVYDPDGQLREFIAPPSQLLPIASRWFMRDANWFVDFSLSAHKVASFFEKEGGPTVDGVIAITPAVIHDLLGVTGPIAVPSYGVTVTQDNFVRLTQDQVTYGYDREANRPKQFLSDLTPLILRQLFAQSAEHSLTLLQTLGHAIAEKQLLVYFRDAALQQRLNAAGWAGAFPRDAQGFLSVNNANIGGHKSDQFIEQEIDYRAQIQETGDVDVVVTVRRVHHGPTEKIDYDYPAGEDPAYKDNIVWQRLFVSRGATLTEARGFTRASDIPRRHEPEIPLDLTPDADVVAWQQSQQTMPDGTIVGQEAGYTYFANWQLTAPGATSVGLYRYRLPRHAALPGLINSAQTFKMYVAKQPGDTRTSVRLELTLPEAYTIRHTTTHGVTPTTPSAAMYRGNLVHDTLFGVVYAKE